MKRWVIVAILLWCCGPGTGGWAEESRLGPDAIHITTQKHVLDNGLTVLVTEMPASHSVSLYAMIKTGSVMEGDFLGAGMTHFIEHMLFKGTEKRAVGDISGEIQAMGGSINASTSFDYTVYTITVPAPAFDKALDVLADMLMNARFEPEEVEKEREVIIKEMRLRNDWPGYMLSQKVLETVYILHPYRLPIIGYEDVFQKVSQEDLLNYYQSFYTPNNMICSVAGDIEAEEALAKVRAAFKDFHRGRYLVRVLPEEPLQLSARRQEIEYPTQLTRMSLAYGGVDFLNDDMPVLDVLSMIMGQGESSRLYQELFKEKHLVRAITASNYTPIDKGVFEIACTLDYEKIPDAIREIEAQITRIAEKGVTGKELDKIKRQVLSEYIGEFQTSESVAFRSAIEEYMAGDPEFSKRYLDMIKQVTSEDLARVARQYLTPDKRSTVILKPKGAGAGPEAADESVDIGDIVKKTLPNGITVLLRENHTFPLVTIMVSLYGGTRYETEELNGLSELMARTWVKGTKSRTAGQIASQVESLGAGFGAFSGRNSMGINASLLSEDFRFGLDLVRETVLEPSCDAETLKKEKELLSTAILARDDDISNMTMEALQKRLFSSPGFRLLSLGTQASVERITRDDVVAFYQRVCSPENMVVSVYGDIDTNAVFKEIEGAFSSLKSRGRDKLAFEEEPLTQTQEETVTVDKEQAMIMVGFRGATIFEEDRYGLQVLAGILGSSFSGRIFNQIREELGSAYTLGGRYVPGLDTGLIYFGVQTTPDQIDLIKARLLKILKDIQEEPVSEKELNDIKSY
ncbi:MAG: pitrilysin family protein, partial [Candidatus Omnitrophota bacterium]